MNVHFVDENTGWAVGDNGMIARTGDGGRTWKPQASTTSELLSDVHFVNRQSGWAVGDYGTVLHTGDGGKIWKSQKTGAILNWAGEHTDTSRLLGVHFINARTGWIVGAYGTVFHTVDGGRTWTIQTTGSAEE
jgi:photosystem II stability/assembly factor-like uncharacterized protein